MLAAVVLADAEGIKALTMRRLAAALDVEAMSLYYHLPGKEALLDGVVETVVAEIHDGVGRLDTTKPDGDWRTRLRFLAAREVMLRHPWAPGLLGSRRTIPAGVFAYYDGIAGTLVGAGFSYHLAHRALHAFGSLPLGFVQEIFSPASAGGSMEVDAAEADLTAMAEALPHLTAMVAAEIHDVTDPTLGWCDSQVEFELPGSVVLPGPPHGLDDVPHDKALICVLDMGAYDAAGYIITETDFANWIGSAADRPLTWLLMDRQVADDLCPSAAESRQSWQTDLEADAEAAAHTDNLLPVARASRSGIGLHIATLRRYAKAFRGEPQGTRYDDLLTDAGVQHIAAVDLEALADDLETWIARDWVAVIDLSAERQNLAGPLPPFPGSGPDGDQSATDKR
ncbi:TetR family transcriptional regulator [Nonomuraea sp. NPDC049141]|uniref:TetR family transcriptional regulator n=1 Tax=Nonomuraea sp. NPDC049141 TaxID=3155500 RepID=UPI0034098FED